MEFLAKNSWTIDLAKVPAYAEWRGDWKYKIDREMVRLILECEEVDENGNPLITDVMKAHFKNNIVDKLRNGVLHIEWSARGGGYGRRYSARDPNAAAGEKFNSAGNLGVHAKRIKNTIFSYQGWVDYDMVKGHPTLLMEMARLANITGGVPMVEKYIAEFDNGLAQEIADYYTEDVNNPVTTNDVKFLFNQTIYGGGHKSWVSKMRQGDPKKGKLPKDVKEEPHSMWKEYKREITRVSDHVYASNPQLVATVASDPKLEEWEKKNRVMSYFCGILENECLKHAYKYGVKHKLFEARSIDLCYDGFSAPPPEGDVDLDHHVQEMNKYIFEKTGMNIRMKVKPFTDVIGSLIELRRSLPEAVPVAVAATAEDEPTDEGTNNMDSEYMEWKKGFEREWCKIRNTAVFLRRYTVNGVFKKMVFHNETSLTVSYKDQCYVKKHSNGKRERIQFISVWLLDPNMKTYEDVGMYPPPLVCPNNVFNMWQPSPYEDQPFSGEDDPEFDKEAVDLFVGHVDMLCNYDETISGWVRMWVAQSIQQPSVKPEHAITFIGNEGTGKSLLVQTIGKLYGEGKTLETTTPERDCWGAFNAPMASAFLVVLNETDKRNSKDAEGRKKGLITDYTMHINSKGKDQFVIESYHRFLETTNTADPNRTSHDDRRSMMVRCNDEKKGDREYFTKLAGALKRPHALRSLYWSFKNADISQWNFRDIPRTSYHETIIEHNRNPVELFMESYTFSCVEKKLREDTANGKTMLARYREWQSATGYQLEINEGTLMKKIKTECNIPEGAIIRGKRTAQGYENTFNIEMLKKRFKIGECLLTAKKTKEEAPAAVEKKEEKKPVVEEEAEVAEEEEGEEIEVFEMEVDGVTYYTDNEETGDLYEVLPNGDVGKKVGKIKDGDIILE